MSCNAHNHPPDCNCGWGGIYHHAYNFKNALLWPLPPKSFINPNAICPVCSASVFFYRDPNGGRVYFDSLGKPWPKHPCTARDASQEVPSSLYWKAIDALNSTRIKLPPFSILLGTKKEMDQWRMNMFQELIKKYKLRALAALWVLDLPPAALEVNDIDFNHVKWKPTLKIAQSIQKYFNNRKPSKTELFSLNLAQFLIEQENKKTNFSYGQR